MEINKPKNLLISAKNLSYLASLPSAESIADIVKKINNYVLNGEEPEFKPEDYGLFVIFSLIKENIDYSADSYVKKVARVKALNSKKVAGISEAVSTDLAIKTAIEIEATPEFTTNNPQPSEIYDYYIDYLTNLDKNLKSLGTIGSDSFDFVYNKNVVEFGKKSIGLTKIAYLNNVKDYKKIIQYYFIKYFSTEDVKNDSLTYMYFKSSHNFFGEEFSNLQQELIDKPSIFDDKLTELFKKINRSVTKTKEYFIEDGVAKKVDKKPIINNVKDFLFLEHKEHPFVVDFLASCYSENRGLVTTNMMVITPLLMTYENTKTVTYETIQKVRSCLLSVSIEINDVKDSINQSIKDYILNYFGL